ncbi:hypothetical protein [Acanthopleuribacter pedis]|uniref:Uncharacterized protein n=1 Tax=Acanthopleuribacter pedis TaxID=442870 RepID=A0A8J7QQ33_9BACT|nr:hypothetical protein [Acanthopleuribacter pedis]MBO1322553.1 hypothetical protein [Acanthopleuribacter pedis]
MPNSKDIASPSTKERHHPPAEEHLENLSDPDGLLSGRGQAHLLQRLQEDFNPKMLDELQEQAYLSSGKKSHMYRENMRMVAEKLNLYADRVQRVRVEELINGYGSLIYIKLNLGAQEIPFDIEFLLELKEAAPKVYSALKRKRSYLCKEHAALFKKFTKSLSLHACIGRLTGRGGEKAATSDAKMRPDLRKQSYGLEAGAETRFGLAVIEHILLDKKNARYQEAVDWLAHSKFESLGALQSHNKKFRELLNNPRSQGTGLVAMSRESHYLLAVEEMLTNENPLGFLRIKDIQPFWNPEQFKRLKQSTKNRHMGSQPEKYMRWCGARLERIFAFLHGGFDPHSLLNLNLQALPHRNSDLTEDYQALTLWLEDVQVHLFLFAETVLKEMSGAREANPALTISEWAENLLTPLKPNELQTFEAINQGDFTRKLIYRVGKLEFEPSGEIATFQASLQLHREIEHLTASLTGWAFKYFQQNGPEDGATRFDAVGHLFKEIRACFERQLQIEQVLIQCYEHLKDYTSVPLEDLRYCLPIIKRTLYSSLHALDFQIINATHYRRRLNEILVLPNPRERQIRLLLLLEELRDIPVAEPLVDLVRKHGADEDPSWVQMYWLFLQCNDENLENLFQHVRNELREALREGEWAHPRVALEAFELINHFSPDLKRALALLEAELAKANAPEDAKGTAWMLMNLEQQIIEGEAQVADKAVLNDLTAQLTSAFKLDKPMLKQLVSILADDHEALYELIESLKRPFGKIYSRHGISRHLSQALHYKDVTLLKKNFDFVSRSSAAQLKAFGFLYTQRGLAVEAIFSKAKKKDATTPPDLKKMLTSGALKTFKKEHRMSAELKLLMLFHEERFLSLDIQLLASFLNFAAPDKLSTKGTFNAYLALFRLLDVNPKYRTYLRHVWSKTRGLLRVYHPESFGGLYRQNVKTLHKNVEDIVGIRLERNESELKGRV